MGDTQKKVRLGVGALLGALMGFFSPTKTFFVFFFRPFFCHSENLFFQEERRERKRLCNKTTELAPKMGKRRPIEFETKTTGGEKKPKFEDQKNVRIQGDRNEGFFEFFHETKK